MRFEEFEKLVASEPPRTFLQTVNIPRPDLLERMKKPGGMLMTEFLAAKSLRSEERQVRYEHVLGPPASREAIEAWQRRHPKHVLPPDLLALVARANGIHLWADDSGRAYEGLAPIEEWDVARHRMYSADSDPTLLADHYVAISYHTDNGAFIVVHPTSGRYYLMDPAGPDETSPIGASASDLLDWLWKTRLPPEKPSR